MEKERIIAFPEELTEEEERKYGFLVCEKFEDSYLSELRRKKSYDWGRIEPLFKEARKFRRNFMSIAPNAFYSVEGLIFELALTERLLNNKIYLTKRRLRVNFDSQNPLIFFQSIFRLKKPEEVYQEERELNQAKRLVDETVDLISREYAHEMVIDQENREFKAWLTDLKSLANNFSLALFEEVEEGQIYEMFKEKSQPIIKKRQRMLELTTQE